MSDYYTALTDENYVETIGVVKPSTPVLNAKDLIKLSDDALNIKNMEDEAKIKKIYFKILDLVKTYKLKITSYINVETVKNHVLICAKNGKKTATFKSIQLSSYDYSLSEFKGDTGCGSVFPYDLLACLFAPANEQVEGPEIFIEAVARILKKYGTDEEYLEKIIGGRKLMHVHLGLLLLLDELKTKWFSKIFERALNGFRIELMFGSNDAVTRFRISWE